MCSFIYENAKCSPCRFLENAAHAASEYRGYITRRMFPGGLQMPYVKRLIYVSKCTANNRAHSQLSFDLLFMQKELKLVEISWNKFIVVAFFFFELWIFKIGCDFGRFVTKHFHFRQCKFWTPKKSTQIHFTQSWLREFCSKNYSEKSCMCTRIFCFFMNVGACLKNEYFGSGNLDQRRGVHTRSLGFNGVPFGQFFGPTQFPWSCL